MRSREASTAAAHLWLEPTLLDITQMPHSSNPIPHAVPRTCFYARVPDASNSAETRSRKYTIRRAVTSATASNRASAHAIATANTPQSLLLLRCGAPAPWSIRTAGAGGICRGYARRRGTTAGKLT